MEFPDLTKFGMKGGNLRRHFKEIKQSSRSPETEAPEPGDHLQKRNDKCIKIQTETEKFKYAPQISSHIGILSKCQVPINIELLLLWATPWQHATGESQ